MTNQEFKEMSLIDHLTELRKRLLWRFIYIIIIFLICFYFASDLFSRMPCMIFIFEPVREFYIQIKNRFKSYNSQTQPLIPFYEERQILFNINGMQEIEKVFEDIKKVIGI